MRTSLGHTRRTLGSEIKLLNTAWAKPNNFSLPVAVAAADWSSSPPSVLN